MGWSIPLAGKATLRQADQVVPVTEDEVSNDIRQKLLVATEFVPWMLWATSNALRRLLNGTISDHDKQVVTEALFKYFNLESAGPAYIVERILRVYEAIWRGVYESYNIYVYKPGKGVAHAEANGYVDGTPENLGPKALSEFFAADANGHVPWDAVHRKAYGDSEHLAAKREIHLSFDYIRKEASESILAKSIIHEGSHKWAFTSDVCYKHGTAGDARKIGLDIQKFSTQLKMMPRHNKDPLIAFAKLDKTTTGIVSTRPYAKTKLLADEPNLWVKNADSYAWMARRLVKKLDQRDVKP